MTTTLGSDDLLRLARRLCDDPPSDLVGRWPRAVALLARQSLEVALDDYWAERSPGVGASRAWRPKLLCLDSYLPDEALGHDVHQAWGSLSRACHVHAYELDPSANELRAWLDSVDDLRARLIEATQ